MGWRAEVTRSPLSSFIPEASSKVNWMPEAGRRWISRAINITPVSWLNAGTSILALLFNRYGRSGSAADKLLKFSHLVGFTTQEELYRLVISH